jgi:hypothetical protein
LSRFHSEGYCFTIETEIFEGNDYAIRLENGVACDIFGLSDAINSYYNLCPSWIVKIPVYENLCWAFYLSIYGPIGSKNFGLSIEFCT